MNSLEIDIEGMQCEGCAEIIQALLKVEPGVQARCFSMRYAASGEYRAQITPRAEGVSPTLQIVIAR